MMASVAAINNLGGHAHNPRGNLWFNDDSTYGHKLLMKMGWNKGKGLGKNEDGIKENLKVKFRKTNSGLGFKDDAYANVMKTEYESILKNLAAEYSCPWTANLKTNVNNSGEEKPAQKSKIVKRKLRYPKLFFGKDVTKYSEKDMKSIFICSTPLKSIEEKSIIAEEKIIETESPQSFDTYNSGLSISDYFAKKMEQKKNSTVNNSSSNIAIHQQTSLESKNSNSSTLTTFENLITKGKQKDSQAGIEKMSSDVEEPDQFTTKVESVGTENLTLSKKKSSRKKKKFEIFDTEVNSDKIEFNNRKEELENSFSKNISHSNNICIDENIINQASSRPNKKRKISQISEDDSLEYCKNSFPCEIKLSLLPSKKKKKKNKTHSTIIQSTESSVCENDKIPTQIHEETNNILLESVETELSKNKDCSKKRKKLKKKLKEKLKSCLKSKSGSYLLKNVSFNESVSYRNIDSLIDSVGSLACNKDLDKNATCYEITESNQNDSNDDAYSDEKAASAENNPDEFICAKEQDKVSEESDEESIISNLPSSKSSHYNAWVESQRLALKMQSYKKMLKSIKNHKILKTTNLLSIKGYGNWNYK